jgi:hypothetical protein
MEKNKEPGLLYRLVHLPMEIRLEEAKNKEAEK